MKLKMKYMKLKNGKKKLNKNINDLIYTQINIYDFQQFETVRSFDDNIYTGKINIDEAESH